MTKDFPLLRDLLPKLYQLPSWPHTNISLKTAKENLFSDALRYSR